MREILFRGKQVYSGEWLYGMPDNEDCSADFPCISPSRNYHTKDTFPLDLEVDPETVGQFTGLTDKNGKKIFEGDILRWIGPDGEGGKVYVTFTRGVFGFQSIECPLAAPDLFADFETGNQTLEVIGNIHDNPELLEAQS